MTNCSKLSRRTMLQGMAGASALVLAPNVLRAQIRTPIRLGGLVPLTGAGGVWGPIMSGVYKAVIDEVNAAGGIGGQKIELFVEDDQTNPDAGVLATRKLIDVNKVCAIMGVWSSGVAAPTLPICWENKVAMLAVAASDTLADLPHQGYFIRTNVHVALQGQKIAEWTAAQGAKNVFVLLAQNPFSDPMLKGFTGVTDQKGIKSASLIYDGRKTSFRSEVDQALGAKPDVIFLGGYPQDNTIIMKDLYRAGFSGKIVGTGTGITAQFIEGAGKDVVEGIYTVQPSPAEGSVGYKRLQQLVKKDLLDTNTCQSYDQVNLALLAIAAAKEATGTAIKDNVRKIGGPPGEPVDSVAEGLKLLAAGKTINYEGASGPCEFLPNGNVAAANFKTLRIKGGTLVPA
jgi:branched-chain amino acid transport system substrate-binding protein